MHYYHNVGHCQFDLLLLGNVEQVIGKMIQSDAQGCTILIERDGTIQSYSWNVVQHIALAP